MHFRTLMGLSFLGIASVLSVGCSNDATARNVTGTVPQSDNITSVVAMKVGNVSDRVSAPVDASGHFTIQLPIGSKYYLAFMSGSQRVGALRYMTSAGTYKASLNITHAPTKMPGVSPADAEANDDGDIEEDDLDLGDVDNEANDDKYEPSSNPEDEIDSDGDGEDDADDHDDGEVDEDGGDDTDNDGLPDEVDVDDDNDGTPDIDEPGT